MKKSFLGLILSITLAASILTGCEFGLVDPLDKTYKVNDIETTARRLFEAGKEDFDYSKYIVCDGSYRYNDKSKCSSKDGSMTYYDHTQYKAGNFTYSRYYQDDENNLSIYSGDFKDIMNHNSDKSISMNERYANQVSISRYKQTQNGEKTTYYQYDGNKDAETFINVEAIFPENFDGIDTIVSRSQENGKNMLDVTLSGDIGFVRDIFGKGCHGYQYAHNIRYSFCLDDNKLKEIVVFGNESTEKSAAHGSVTGREVEVGITLDIKEMSNETVTMPELPNIMSENDDINRILTGEDDFAVTEGIDNPVNCNDEFCQKAVHIWEDLMELPMENRNTLTEISSALSDLATEHGYFDCSCNYALLGKEKCVVRFTFYNNMGKEAGHIYVPFKCTIDNDKHDKIIFGNAFCVSGEDILEAGSEGGFSFTHVVDQERQHHYKYWLDKNMNLELAYRDYRVERMSLLKKDEELENFAPGNRDELKRIAEEFRFSGFFDITEYYVSKDEEAYYTIDSQMSAAGSDDIKGNYDINLVTDEEMKEHLVYYDRKETQVSWVQICDE